jgi:hypothetical protein
MINDFISISVPLSFLSLYVLMKSTLPSPLCHYSPFPLLVPPSHIFLLSLLYIMAACVTVLIPFPLSIVVFQVSPMSSPI